MADPKAERHQGGAGMNPLSLLAAAPLPNPPPGPAQAVPAQTRLLQEFKHTSPLVGCRFDPTGRFVFAGAQDNSIQRWDLATGKKTALVGHKSWVRALAFAAAERAILI